MVAPPEVLEYVVVHELCHLRKRWLREHGQELHDYDPAVALR
jgi:predicted metal-dependent hydrolase